MRNTFFSLLKAYFMIIYAVNIFANGQTSDGEFRIKLDISQLKDGQPVGWKGCRGGGWSDFSYDEQQGIATFTLKGNWQGITKNIELPPGRYLLCAVARSNSFAPKLYIEELPLSLVNIFHIAIGISGEFHQVQLPFFVDGQEKKKFQLGIARVYQDPSLHEAIVQVKEMEVIRLGDTVLPENWVAKTTVSLIHGLETLKKISRPDRPGRVIFSDAMLGTELWLMTQGGEVNLSYAGFPDFSNDGKYFHAGFRTPGDVIRTDGSFRYKNPLLNKPGGWSDKTLWLFPWEEKRLPKGSSPSDWICPIRTNQYVEFYNLETRGTHRVSFPSRDGWKIIQYPSMNTSRGPKISSITYEVLVWQSDDRQQIAISDIEGNNFRAFRIKSISKNPENDVVYPVGEKGMEAYPINSVWGKSGKNWTHAVDKNGTRYFAFEINRNNYFTDENPYQVWMLPLSFTDTRGLLRVIPTPGVKQIPESNRQAWKGDTWWNLAGGSPRSGDNAILTLEDGTLVHMSALGMHSNFQNTVSVNCPYQKTVRFIGSYQKLDHVCWPDEFRRDRDYAFVYSEVAPTLPFIMIDLEHDTFWTVAAMNIVDADERAAAASRLGRTPAKIIYSVTNPSPDYTKVLYASSMLTVGRAEYEIADAYIAVARYPQPPVNLKIEKTTLTWEKPRYHAEIKGYNLYYSNESGIGYAKVNKELLTGQSYTISSQNKGFYVMTSVEHSGLESRMFSNEVHIGTDSRYRYFYEAEEGKINKPMVPFFEPKSASNVYGIAVTDPELLYKKTLSDGLKGSVVLDVHIPVAGTTKLMVRTRALSRLECETYTTGWPEEVQSGKGSFTVKVDGQPIGSIEVSGCEWKWGVLNTRVFPITAGKHKITIETGDVGIAADNILLTNDLEFIPEGKSNTPVKSPTMPDGLKAEDMVVQGEELKWGGYNVKPPYFRLIWNESKAPQGVRYYNIYRSENPNVDVSPTMLVGSTTQPVFVDCVLEEGKTYYYKVSAVDNWNNHSVGSQVLAVTIH